MVGAWKSSGALTSCSKSHTTHLKRDLYNCRCFKTLGNSLTPWILPSLTSHIESIRNSCQFPLQKYLETARISLFILSLPCPGLCHLWPAEEPPASRGASFPLTHSPCSCQNGCWKTPVRPCTGFLPHLERSPRSLPDPTGLPLSSTTSHLSHAGFAHG